MRTKTTKITIPLGATVRVRRATGAIDTYIFRGTNSDGPIFEHADGSRHQDVGQYIGIAVDLPPDAVGK